MRRIWSSYRTSMILMALLVSSCVSADNRTDYRSTDLSPSTQTPPESSQTVIVTGRVRLVGSEPFSNTVISDELGNDWYLADVDAQMFRGLENSEVTVRAILEERTMTLADGRHAGVRKELSEVEIVDHSPRS
jgi:hypothetical protein